MARNQLQGNAEDSYKKKCIRSADAKVMQMVSLARGDKTKHVVGKTTQR